MATTFEATTMAVYLSLNVEVIDDQRGTGLSRLFPSCRWPGCWSSGGGARARRSSSNVTVATGWRPGD